MLRCKIEFNEDGATFVATRAPVDLAEGEEVSLPVVVADLIAAGDTHGLLLFGILTMLGAINERASRPAPKLETADVMREVAKRLREAGLAVPGFSASEP